MTNTLYTATATATPGAVEAPGGALSLEVHEPTELGGPGGGTNPEQLMAAALASCLLESLRIAASTSGGNIDNASVEGSVTLTDTDGVGYDAEYSLRVTLPDAESPKDVLDQAVSICPFLRSVNGVDVSLA